MDVAVVRDVFKTQPAAQLGGELHQLHPLSHRAKHWPDQAEEAHTAADPAVLQPHQGERQGETLGGYGGSVAVQPSGAGHPHGAAAGAPAGSERADHQPQPLRQLPYPQAGEEGDEDHPAGADRGLSPAGEGEGDAAHVLSGADQRPAPGRAAGPAVDGSGRGEADDYSEQVGEPDKRRAGGVRAQNAELGAHGGYPTAGGGSAGGGQEELPGQPVPVPVSQDGWDVEPGCHRADAQGAAAGGGDRRRGALP